MRPRLQWLSRLLAGAVAMLLAVTVKAAPRVALVVTGPEEAADWQAVLTAELSRAEAWSLVERAELTRLWLERAQGAISQIAGAPPTPQRVEVYLHARRISEGRWIIDAVNATDGVALGSGAAVAGQRERMPAVLAEQAKAVLTAALEQRRDRAVSPKRTRVAVIERGKTSEIAVPVLASRLRRALADNRLVVLDRALTQDLLVERNDAHNGFRADAAPGAFLGVDYWIELTSADARVVRAGDGIVLGVRDYDPAAEDAVDALQRWAYPFMGGRVALELAPYVPTVEIEALAPFYRGLALYDEGRFADATAEFSRAYQLNGRFREAFEWEARCYEALDMGPLATALRRYVALGLLENISAAGARITSGTGLAFLGVVAWDGPEGALSRSVSAQAASTLARREELELRIPDQLDELRREYDWMSGIDGKDGSRWEQAPDLFCRSAVSGILSRADKGVKIEWRLRDTMSGRMIAMQTQALDPDPAAWPKAINQFLKSWPDVANRKGKKEAAATAGPAVAATRATETVEALAATLSSATGNEANVARIKLALLQPGHPLVVGRAFVKGGDKGDADLSGFIEYAMREWLIARLPVGDKSRRLLELACLQDHLEPSGEGKLYAGREIDGVEALRALIEVDAADPAGLVARYRWLYEQQAKLSPAKLADACAKLKADVTQFAAALPDVVEFANLIESLQRLARIAGGDAEVEAWANHHDKTPAPRRVKAVWNKDGRFDLEFVRPEFSTWQLTALDPSVKAVEARAVLALNGRGRIPGHFDERWFTEFPNSLTLCAYIADRFYNSTRNDELPIAHPFDWKSAAALRMACVTYAADTIERHMRTVKTKEELARVDFVALNFFSALNTHDLIDAVSDEAYEAMRARILAPYLEAKIRFNHMPSTNSRLLYWTEMTRALARQERKDHLRWPGNWVKDRRALIANAESMERSLLKAATLKGNGAIFDPTRWWDLLRRWEFNDGMTAPELAEFYRRRTPDVLRRFADTQPTVEELPKFYEQALVLFYGRCDVEAEQLFQRVLAIPDGTYWPAMLDEYRANAACRLAQLFRLNGRIPEALAMARQGLEWDRSGPHRYIQERATNIWNANSLAGHLLRVLRELRYDPAQAQLPDRVGVVSVATPNGDNPKLHVFYRMPPKGDDSSGPRRILVLAPVHNQDAVDYLRADGGWARFADERGLVLVVPQFYVSDRIFRADHRFTHVRYAHIWSGDALLRALDEINRAVPIEKGRLLVHGVASGSGFACHLAAWRPDLVAAVSVNNGNWGMPRFLLPGLQPMSAQTGVRYFVTASAEDRIHRAYDCSVDFVTRLRGAGVSVDWRVWPGGVHTPTFEMEEAARAFLASQLSTSP